MSPPTRPRRTTARCRSRSALKLTPRRGVRALHAERNHRRRGVSLRAATDGVPLVADMSSTILSRPIDVSKFGLIYAGAQKNIGPSGLVVVIVRDDLLGKARQGTPSVWDYKAMADEGSMLNTPPTFGWYFAGLVFKWLKAQGGLAAMDERNRAKAEKLYGAIEESGFYRNPVAKNCRSWMNVPFTAAEAGPRERLSCAKRSRRASPISKDTARSAACARASTTPCRRRASMRSSTSCRTSRSGTAEACTCIES